MIRLWGRASSVNVQKVLWALAEIGLEVEHKIVGGPYGGTQTAEFGALNPLRRVPVLEDDGQVIWESNAILRHLSRSYPSGLTPQGHSMSQADQWMDFGLTTLFPPFVGLFWQAVRLPIADRDPTVAARHEGEMLAAFDVLETRLAQSPWLAGERFSIADISIGVVMERACDLSRPTENRSALARWHEAMRMRRAYREVVMTSYEELRATN